MSQRSQEFSSFSDLDIFGQDIVQEINQHVGSQELRVLFSDDFNGPYDDLRYPSQERTLNEENTVPLEDIKNFNFGTEVAPHLLPLLATDVLSGEEYIGPYEFDVLVVPNHKSKNPWVYSPRLNKVFMDMNQQFPVDFKIKNRSPDKQLFIRTTPQYSAQHYAGDPVCRCIQHDHHADPTNKDIAEHVRQHVIRCANMSSYYVGNVKEGHRLSIVFPLSIPQAGSESVRELFQFVCKSSCPAPGMNRRGIEVFFTLEDDRGNVLGRKCLKVRICACPKRDKEKEEEAAKTNGTPSRGKKRKTENLPSALPGKVIPQTEDFKAYNLNMSFIGKQNVLDILGYAEKVYMSKAYQLRDQPQEQELLKNLADIQTAKKQLQQTP